MEKHTRKLLTVTFALSLFISMSLILTSSSMYRMVSDERMDTIEQSRTFSPSAQKTTTWYHDGSNTTGWVPPSSNGCTLNSSGTALYTNITPSGAGTVYAIFTYPLEHHFVVGHDFKMEAQVEYTSNPNDNGGTNLMACSSVGIEWRLPFTSSNGNEASWALNYYGTGLNDYDEEHNYTDASYTSMWYNDTDSSTRTNLGDGIVSTSEHAGETRIITTLVLNFRLDDYATNTYPDFRIDWIKMTGGALPEIDSPDDIEMGYMDSVDLTWSPDAYTPESYKFYIDDVLEETGVWDGSDLSFPLDDLEPGYYKCELEVYDDMDFTTSDIVWVNVTDTTAPVVSDVADFSIPVGVDGEYIIWTCSEPFPDYFIITRDSVVIDEGTWNGTDLRVNLNGLSVDSYVFELTVNDTYANSASDDVIVSVVTDRTPPSLTPLNDVSFEFGTKGHSLTWICSDLFPSSFSITQNGTVVDSGLWNGSNLAVNLDELSVGVYNFTIVLYDSTGNSASDFVTVTVTLPETTSTTSITSTTPTTTTTSTTPTTSTSPTGTSEPIDSMLLVIAGAIGVIVLLIVVIVLIKKK